MYLFVQYICMNIQIIAYPLMHVLTNTSTFASILAQYPYHNFLHNIYVHSINRGSTGKVLCSHSLAPISSRCTAKFWWKLALLQVTVYYITQIFNATGTLSSKTCNSVVENKNNLYSASIKCRNQISRYFNTEINFRRTYMLVIGDVPGSSQETNSSGEFSPLKGGDFGDYSPCCYFIVIYLCLLYTSPSPRDS